MGGKGPRPARQAVTREGAAAGERMGRSENERRRGMYVER